MAQSALVHQISNHVERLPPDLQHLVLDFTQALGRAGAEGATGKGLLRFAGAIDKADLEEMSRAIESECERIDGDGW